MTSTRPVSYIILLDHLSREGVCLLLLPPPVSTAEHAVPQMFYCTPCVFFTFFLRAKMCDCSHCRLAFDSVSQHTQSNKASRYAGRVAKAQSSTTDTPGNGKGCGSSLGLITLFKTSSKKTLNCIATKYLKWILRGWQKKPILCT